MSRRDRTCIALVGEDRGHRSHQELNALRSQLDVRTAWVATDSGTSLEGFDGIWLVPGSPYADDLAADAAIRRARENGIPFLGTCGGLQYAVIESVRNWLGGAASHEESDGVADDNVVTKLACSLYGEVRQVVPSPGTWFADLMGGPFEGPTFATLRPRPVQWNDSSPPAWRWVRRRPTRPSNSCGGRIIRSLWRRSFNRTSVRSPVRLFTR